MDCNYIAVVKVLYNHQYSEPEYTEDELNVEEKDDSDVEEEGESETDDAFIEGFSIVRDSPGEIDVTNNKHIYPIIQKVRKVVKLFRRSPKNNDFLQKHVKDEFKKEISLILDTKTRWNSLLTMLECFILLKTSIQKSVIDLNINICFLEYEFKIIKDIIASLLPIKLAVEAMCSSDCTLLSADATIKFMLDELSKQNTNLSNKLKSELVIRMQERRTNYSDILQYLHNSNESKTAKSNNNYGNGLFNTTSKTVIIKLIVCLVERLLNIPGDSIMELSDIDEHDKNSSEMINMTM